LVANFKKGCLRVGRKVEKVWKVERFGRLKRLEGWKMERLKG